MKSLKQLETTETFKNFKKEVENKIQDPYQTVRDTSNEIGKDYMSRLRSTIEKNKSLHIVYYIDVFSRFDLPIKGLMHNTFISRISKPIPEWQHAVYEIDNNKNTIRLLWALPSEAEARQVVKKPNLFSEKFVKDCTVMLSPKESLELMQPIVIDV